MNEHRIKVGITQGDPNGIGWEVILKALSDARMTELCTPVLYGSGRAGAYYKERIEEAQGLALHPVASAAQARRGRVNLVECGSDFTPEPGRECAEAGAAAVAALRAATDELKNGGIDVLVTAPISKEAVQSDDFRFTGHTEFLASQLDGEPLMILCSELLRVGLVTIHLPVSQVSEAITTEKVLRRLRQLRHALKSDFGIVEPRIAVLSLNPHAGDGGLLGEEERQRITPAIVAAFAEGVLAFGPFAADGLFSSGAYKRYDAVLAMYHDQGLTPFKTLSPDGVNFTAGLSRIRTSPDHGVAYDIAGQGIADERSMREAIYAAIDIFLCRARWQESMRNPLQRFERDKGRDVSVSDLPVSEERG